ncbi:hypothetical protein FIU82_05145 [Pseudoalteromonas sp. THAF3]|nr:hypothetical protein FIU82_05145 [Pseudoalteromonas sp. THAF3]
MLFVTLYSYVLREVVMLLTLFVFFTSPLLVLAAALISTWLHSNCLLVGEAQS